MKGQIGNIPTNKSLFEGMYVVDTLIGDTHISIKPTPLYSFLSLLYNFY